MLNTSSPLDLIKTENLGNSAVLNPTTELKHQSKNVQEEKTKQLMYANIQSIQNVKQEDKQKIPIYFNKPNGVITLSSDEEGRKDYNVVKHDDKTITEKRVKEKVKRIIKKKKKTEDLTRQEYIKKINAAKNRFTIRSDALRLRKADKKLTKRESMIMAKKLFESKKQ